MMRTRVTEIRNIQVLRGLAAMAVVLFHVELYQSKAVDGHGIPLPGFGQGEAGVDLFFVISGFIMVYIQQVPLDSLKSYARFMVHRITRIYPPFWLVMVPLMLLYMVHPHLFNNYNQNKVEVARSFWLLPQDYIPLLGVSWTLIHELYFYIVVSLALCLRHVYRILFGAGWFLIVLAVYCAAGRQGFGGNRWLELIFSPFSLTFMLGYFIALWYTWRPAANGWFGLLCVGFALCGFAISYKYNPGCGVYPDNNHLYRLFYFGVPSAFMLLGFVLLERATQRRFARLRNLGNESYAIYLLHLPIITAIYKGVEASRCTNLLFLAMVIPLAVGACIGAAILFHKYIEMRVTRYARKTVETWLGISDPGYTTL